MFALFQAVKHIFSTKASRVAGEAAANASQPKHEFVKMTPAQRKKHLAKMLKLKKLAKAQKELKAKQAKNKKALEAKRKKALDALRKKLKVGRVVSIKGVKYVVVGKKRGKPVMTTLAKFKRSKKTRIKISKQPIVVVNNYTTTSSDDGFGLIDAIVLAEILTIDSSPSYQPDTYEASSGDYSGDGGGFSGGGASGGWDDSSSSSSSSDDSGSSSDSSSDSGSSSDSSDTGSSGGSDN
jgi:hypothetical protein